MHLLLLNWCGNGISRARQLVEPPTADPHGGWCGEGRLEAGPYPISFHKLYTELCVPGTSTLASTVMSAEENGGCW